MLLFIWLFLDFSFVNLSILPQEDENIQKNIVGSYQAWLCHSLAKTFPYLSQGKAVPGRSTVLWLMFLGKPVRCSVRQWWGDMRMSAVRGWPSRFFLQASRWQLFYFFTYKFVFLLQCLAEREWSGLQRTSMQGKQGEVPLLPSLRLSSCPASAQGCGCWERWSLTHTGVQRVLFIKKNYPAQGIKCTR